MYLLNLKLEYFKKPLKQLHSDLVGKKTSVMELVKASLDRIKETDDQLNSFITVRDFDELKPEIMSAQKKIDAGNSTLITGIPYSAKDLFNTEGVRTTASSKILDNYIPPYESTVTRRLKESGAILVGKTNTDAFAHGSSTETSDYFPSRNPWDLDRSPGGSSGGSASSVASLQVAFSIGTETAGSIRQPAALTGLTGLKGTYGRVSRYGVIAMGSSLDCPGPITRSAEDAGIVMAYISGEDTGDSTTIKEQALDLTDISRKDLRGLRVGISSKYLSGEGVEKGVSAVVKSAIDRLKELGADIVEIELLDPKYSIAVYTLIQRSEVSSNLARYHGTRYGAHKKDPVETVYDYFKDSRSIFGFEAKRRMMTGAYALSTGYYDKYYRNAQKVRTVIINDIKTAFEKVDIFVAPTSPNVATTIGESTKNPLFGEMADRLISASTMAGLPGISVPVGFSEGLPVGMQIIAPQKQERLICEVAGAYQNSTDWHSMTPYDYKNG